MNSNAILQILKALSNPKKLKIVILTQDSQKNITELSKEIKIAYNKCSNYCTQLEKLNIITKTKIKKEVYVKSKINISQIKEVFHIFD